MADNEIKIGFKVSSEGTTDAETRKALKLKAAYDEVANAAKSAGTAGSRAAAAKSGGGASGLMSGQEYGQLRGSSGSTGASARDFANQAQGLGGLVRVYATFAANLFAVSAAFTALKNAADTTNMIKGLDELGAASGRNLGNLSKRLVEVTDGSISLKEAMTATAQATSAGMSSQNLERLAKVAKNASQALGIGMSDALSRLSRGVSKIEPELLDEIGLFVKVDDAVAKYAASVGKTAGSLTEFEKRHAFAMEAIKQGEEKFGTLQIDANPYDKLLASVTNLGQKTLEVINTGLGPLVDVLSKSPVALGTALAAIAGLLLKQAIPAVGEYRKQLGALAADNKNKLNRIYQDQQEFLQHQDQMVAETAEKAFKASSEVTKRVEKLKTDAAQFSASAKTDFAALASKDPFELTPAEIKSLDGRLGYLKKHNKAEYDALSSHMKEVKRLRQEAENEGIAAQARYESKTSGIGTSAGQTEIIRNRALRSFSSSEIRSVVAETQAVYGASSAWKQLNAEIALSKAGKRTVQTLDETGKVVDTLVPKTNALQNGWTRLTGAFGIATGAISKALSAFGPWIEIIGLAVGALSFLFSTMSKTKEESARTSEAFDMLDGSLKNVALTAEKINLKKPLDQISIESISARANAFSDLSENVTLLIKRTYAEFDKMGNSDMFLNWTKKLWGGDLDSKLNKGIAKALISATEVIENSAEGNEVRKRIKDTLGIEDINADSIEKSLAKLPETVRRAKLESISKDLEKASTAAMVTAAKGNELKDVFKEAGKTLQDITNSFIPSDNVTKFGMQVVDAAGKMSLALEDPVQSINAMQQAVKDPKSLALFPPEQVAVLQSMTPEINRVAKAYADTNKEVKDIEKQIENLKTQIENVVEVGNPMGDQAEYVQYSTALDDLNTKLTELQSKKDIKATLLLDITAEGKVLADQMKKSVTDQFKYGADIVANRLSQEWVKSGQIIGNTVASLLGDTKAGIELRMKLETEALQVQKRTIETQLILARSTELNRISTDELTLALMSKDMDAKDQRLLGVAEKQKSLEYQRQTILSASQGAAARVAADVNAGVAGAKEVYKTVVALEGLQQQIFNVNNQIDAALLKSAEELAKKDREEEKRKLQAKQDTLKAELDSLNIIQSISALQNPLLDAEKQKLQSLQEQGASALKLFDIETQIKAMDILIKDPKAAAYVDKVKKAKEELEARKTLLTIGTTESKQLLDSKQAVEKIGNAYKLQVELQDRDFAVLQRTTNERLSQVKAAKDLLGLYKEQGIITESSYLKDKARLDNLEEQYNTQRDIDQIRKQATEKTGAAETAISQAKAVIATPGVTQQTVDAANSAILAQQKLIQDTNADADSQIGILLRTLEIRTQINTETATYASLISTVTSATESLAIVFEGMGDSIKKFGEGLGKTLGSLSKFTTQGFALEAKHARSLQGLEKGSDEYTEQSKKNAAERERFEVESIANIAGSSKSLFKEKTAAYKLLSGIEKAMHIAKLAMDVKEMFSDTAKTGSSIANSLARAGAAGLEAITKAFAAPFPIGFVAGAAMTAIITGLLGAAFGGKASAAPAGFSAEEQQKVQGTGQKYASDGTIVLRAGGVTGDATAVAKSVTTSIDNLSKQFFGLLGSDSSRIVKGLKAIEDNTGNVVKALLGKLVGIGGGSAFGTVESSSKTLGGLWGKSSTVITDAGLIIQGVLSDLAAGIGRFQQYENVVSSSSSWFGLKKSTRYMTNLRNVESGIVQSFSDIFSNVGDVLIASAESLEGSGKRAADMLAQIPIDMKVSIKGMTGTEAANAIMAEISVQLNAAAEKVFPYIAQYNKIGEEMYQTVARIVKDGEVLNQGLQMIGKTMSGISAEVTVAFQQDLIAKAGGIDKFASSVQYYYDNFLTAQERYQVSFKNLNQMFKEAGMSVPKSKQQYIDLIKTLDTTTDSGRSQLALLLNLSQSYNDLLSTQTEVYKDQISALSETVTKFKDFVKTLNNFRDSLLLSASSTATPLEKYAEAKTQFESTYALALAGDKDAMGKLTSISQTFLDLSKQLYASSDKYTEDFGMVLDKINSASISASASADVAQLQLDAINTQVDLLTSINTNIASIAGLPAAANGGLVRGLTLVGERGPELVDFNTPGRVYTADQTAGMFTSGNGMGGAIGSMVAEIKQLREEVVQLRKDQQKQTGDLIVSNYDANQKAADNITSAVSESVNGLAWDSRIKAEIK